MVELTNITFDNEWIYADAYDCDYNVRGKIKVHRTKEIFETDCKSRNCFRWAASILVNEVNEGKISQSGKRTMVWG